MSARRDVVLRSVALAGALFASPLVAPAGARLIDGKVAHRPATDPAVEVARLRQTPETVWLAWSVPARGGHQAGAVCGFGRGRNWGVTLGEEESSWGTRDDLTAVGVGSLEIYAAVRAGEIRQLQFASEGCPVRAGALPVVWLDGVTPAASIALCAQIAARRDDSKAAEELSERALAGLALHADPEAALALVHLVRESRVDELRSQSLFWLAQTGEPQVARWIREAIARDPAPAVREQGVFALSQLADATPELLALLRESADRAVQRQAIFWLGQSDDPRATAELERLLTR